MKFLVTGAKGQLGSRLASDLRPLGDVVALGRDDLDLCDADAVTQTIKDAGADVLFNTAAYTAVDQAESERDAAFAVNATAPGVIGKAAAAAGTRVVHFSTDYVFDGTLDRPYREDDDTNPINVYGKSKRAGEHALLSSGAKALVFRVSWLYAETGKNFMRTMLHLAAERDRLDVVDDQIGAPTYVGSLSSAMIRLVERWKSGIPETGGGASIYHLTADGAASWRDFAAAIVDSARRHGHQVRASAVDGIPSSAFVTAAARPKNSRLDQTKVRRDLDLHLPKWQDALELAIAKTRPVG
ncbi:MAG: dTDP-4-dehydrorhamnose reductase [Rhodospirillales bacterium]|nr:dTDP-4-dehydrorhamnose reductase [Rhodospirillales bacterium]